MVIDLAGDKAGKQKQRELTKHMNATRCRLHNGSASTVAGRKRPTAQLQNRRRSKSATASYDLTRRIPRRALSARESLFREQQLVLLWTTFLNCFSHQSDLRKPVAARSARGARSDLALLKSRRAGWTRRPRRVLTCTGKRRGRRFYFTASAFQQS